MTFRFSWDRQKLLVDSTPVEKFVLQAVTWPAATRIFLPTTKGGREERPWERGWWMIGRRWVFLRGVHARIHAWSIVGAYHYVLHYAKDSGNFGRNSNGKIRFGFFWLEYSYEGISMTKFNNQENWYQIIQIGHASIQSWIAASEFCVPNRKCIKPKLKGKNPFQARWVVKAVTQIGITRKRITQIGITQINITRKGITQKAITRKGITQIGITRNNQRR